MSRVRNVWTSVLVPNPNGPETPKMILRKVPALASDREPSCSSTPLPNSTDKPPTPTLPSSTQDLVRSSDVVLNPNRLDSPKLLLRRGQDLPVSNRDVTSSTSSSVCSKSPPMTGPPSSQPVPELLSHHGLACVRRCSGPDFVWTSDLIPNPNHSDIPRLLLRTVPVPTSIEDSSSPSSSQSPTRQLKHRERGRKAKVYKPRRLPGKRQIPQEQMADTKKPRMAGPAPRWVRNIRAILKERKTQTGNGCKTRSGQLDGTRTSPSSPKPYSHSVQSSCEEKESPGPTPGPGPEHVAEGERPDQEEKDPGHGRTGGKICSGQLGSEWSAEGTYQLVSSPIIPSLSSSSSSSWDLSSDCASPELHDQSELLEKLMSSKDDF